MGSRRADFSEQRGIVYQGFLLLTANQEVLHHPPLIAAAAELNATPAQLVTAFARAIGILPLTSTSSADHMNKDLASVELKLPAEAMESIAG
jgi:diketogulonate reductase-like aldo/keto reductase